MLWSAWESEIPLVLLNECVWVEKFCYLKIPAEYTNVESSINYVTNDGAKWPFQKKLLTEIEDASATDVCGAVWSGLKVANFRDDATYA